MRSLVTRSRVSTVLVALTFAIAPACENQPATVGDQPSTTSSVRSETTPATDASTSEGASSSLADRSAPSDPAPQAAATVVEPAQEIVWSKGSLEEALEQAKKQDKLVFIDFWTTWCGWCKKLDHDTYTDPKVIAALNEHYVCLSIDAESKLGAPIARRYSVNGYPTLLFLTTDGLVRERVAGYKPPEKFLPIAVQTAKPR